MLDSTQPTSRLDRSQTVRTTPVTRRRKRRLRIFIVMALIVVYFFAPFRTNILFLGTDDSPERGGIGRTDTILLATVVPLKPYIGVLSIPRDLWVQIPNVGEQRINTAYFFAEANKSGTGVEAVRMTIHKNLNVPVRYHVLIQMTGLVPIVDALGGVDVVLDTPGSGLPAGTYHLDGLQALAFARDRSAGDDFGRMIGTQKLIIAMIQKLFQPSSWNRLPQFGSALSQTIDTNIPLWQWPRLLFAIVRAPLFGIDGRTIGRDMVTPYTTSGGAQVLLPNWDAIRPMLKEMFAR